MRHSHETTVNPTISGKPGQRDGFPLSQHTVYQHRSSLQGCNKKKNIIRAREAVVTQRRTRKENQNERY